MSYYDQVIKDCPESFQMFDQNFTNTSGKPATSSLTGTITEYGPGLASGATRSPLWNSGSSQEIYFPYMTTGKERQSFTLESWFRPVQNSGVFYIASNANTYDGLVWNGQSVTFNLKLSSGYVGVEYTPPVLSNMHIVGVYTGTTLILYIDGNPVRVYELTATEKTLAMVPVTPSSYIYHGAGVGLSNGLATYYLPLPAERILSHYEAGIDTRTNDAASTMYGGTYERIGMDQGDTFLSRVFNDQITYENAIYTCNVGETLTPKTDEAGATLSSQWQTAVPLGQGGTDINGVKMKWTGTGLFSIYTSIDEINWTIATKNNFKVPTIVPGFDGTGKYLYIKVQFFDGYVGEVKSITLNGYKSMEIETVRRPITIPDDSVLFSEDQVISYNDANGLYTSAGLTIGPTPESDPAYAIGFWFNCPTGDVTVNVTPSAYYENGLPRAVRTVNGRWTYVVYVFPAKTTDIIITGNMNIISPTIYSDTLTDSQVYEIYRSYTGYPSLVLDTSGTMSINTPDVKIYGNSWSTSGA